jgi:hypothetical protein
MYGYMTAMSVLIMSPHGINIVIYPIYGTAGSNLASHLRSISIYIIVRIMTDSP